MHPNLGILNGVESMLYTVSIVDPIKLPDDLVELLKLDDTMVICSDNVAPNDVRMGKGAGTLIFQSVNPSPIKNIKRIKSNGFKVDATKSSTPCYGPMLNSPHYYQMSGSIKASTELECWLRFKF